MMKSHQLRFLTRLLPVFWLGVSGVGYGEVDSIWRQQLGAGDPEGIKRVEASGSLDDLYQILQLARRHQFDGQSESVKVATVAAIRRIPGHARVLGDEIEQLCSQLGTGRVREKKFMLLAEVGSREAIIQIARFLYDERNPDSRLPRDDGSFQVPNSHWAAIALGVALQGQHSLAVKPGSYGRDEVKEWQMWWETEGVKKYGEEKVNPLGRNAGSLPVASPTWPIAFFVSSVIVFAAIIFLVSRRLRDK